MKVEYIAQENQTTELHVEPSRPGLFIRTQDEDVLAFKFECSEDVEWLIARLANISIDMQQEEKKNLPLSPTESKARFQAMRDMLAESGGDNHQPEARK